MLKTKEIVGKIPKIFFFELITFELFCFSKKKRTQSVVYGTFFTDILFYFVQYSSGVIYMNFEIVEIH